MLSFEYISDPESLTKLVAQYQQSDLLVLDTEFVRTRTYYAKLGLIQAYDGKTLALIDPVALPDLSEFWTLLSDTKITKLVHSCSEDLEVFARYGQCQPSPLFDSQIAATLSGLGHGLGYAKLVNTFLEIEIDKGESRTDWMKRPLSDAQLQYAANDVYYLYKLYPQLVEKINQANRMEWLLEEGERMTEGRLTPPNEELAYLKIKNAFQLFPQQLAYLKVLATWRLKKALKKDSALGFIVKDHALIALAKKQPKTVVELNQLNDLTEHEKRFHGKDIIKVLQTADLDNLPEAVDVIALKNGYKSSFKEVKNILTLLSEEHEVAVEFIGSKRLIHEFLLWLHHKQPEDKPLLLKGWRGDIVKDALAGINFS
ncbi:ribonuclease D [Shewanella donghaensis]|uniref:ribonuclease D n=1 Tax=Shewanella donghaensis TaxID=238836 RepID=UPI001182EAAD|nr:ribonuclease D [Shewanella donghaensis]